MSERGVGGICVQWVLKSDTRYIDLIVIYISTLLKDDSFLYEKAIPMQKRIRTEYF